MYSTNTDGIFDMRSIVSDFEVETLLIDKERASVIAGLKNKNGSSKMALYRID